MIGTDNLMVLQSIRRPMVMLSYFGDVIKDCKGMLVSLFEIFLQFVKRSGSLSRKSFLFCRRSYY